jgi:hypothetical protein
MESVKGHFSGKWEFLVRQRCLSWQLFLDRLGLLSENNGLQSVYQNLGKGKR